MIKHLMLLCAAGALVTACQGGLSPEPPIHPNPNMDQQHRFDPQEPSEFFADGRVMRPRVEGTVPWGHLEEDDHLYRGMVDGEFATALPEADADGQAMALDRPFLDRGRDRFDIFCAPCHDSTGGGKGVVVERGMNPPPPSFYDQRLTTMAIGQLYDVVTNGFGNMSAYRNQISLRDRWAVAAYVRTLQLSRSVGLDQIPADKASAERWEVR